MGISDGYFLFGNNGGGGGTAVSNVFDVFANGGVPYEGIRARYGRADGGWSARGIQSVSGVQASVFLPISGTPGAGWRFTFEETLEIGAAGNAWRLLRFPRSPIIPAVAASLQWEYRPARYVTITAATAGTVGNSYAMNAFILGSTGVVSYLRSNAQGPRFDVRVIPSTTVADLITGANAAFSDVVFSPGTGYIATDTLTNQLLGPGGSGYAGFLRGADEVPAETILATVHSFPSTAFTLRIAATDTLADIRSEIISYLISEGIVLSTVGVVDEAADTFDVPAVDPGLDFAGGVNVIPLGASVDELSKIIDVTYDAGTNTLAEILAEMEAAGLQTEYRGSVDGTETLEAVGWVRTLGPITAAGATTGTGSTAPALTGAQIKQRYEANPNTNAFTDAEQSKLTTVEVDATSDQTGAEIKTAYEGESDTNAFTNVQKTKLDATLSTSDLLAKILSGAGIAIDRLTTPGEIIVSSMGGVGGGAINLGIVTPTSDRLTAAAPSGYSRYPKGTLLLFKASYGQLDSSWTGSLKFYIGTDHYDLYGDGTSNITYGDLVADTYYLAVVDTAVQILGPVKTPVAISIADVLAAIFAGTNITIDDTVDGRITIASTAGSSSPAGAGSVTGVSFAEATQSLTFVVTGGSNIVVSLGLFITASELVTALTPYTKADGTVAFTAVVGGVTPTDDAHLSTKKYVDDADALRALLSGATFTGVTGGIDPVGSSDFVTKGFADTNYSGGSPTPTTAHDLIAGWSADTSISDAEIMAGANSATNSVVLPTETGSLYMFIWRANADGGDPSEVHIGPAGNSRTLFGAATAKTVGSIVGVLIVSVNTFNTVATGGETVRVT